MRCILCLLAATALFATNASGQGEDPGKDVQVLRSKLHFVSRLAAKYPESGFGGMWKHLDEDIQAALREHGSGGGDGGGDSGDLHSLRRETLLSWGEHYRKTGNTDLALEPYELLIGDYSVDDEGYRDAAKAAAAIHVGKAETAESDKDKLAAYDRAGRLYDRIGDARRSREIRTRTVDLKGREGVRLAEAKEYGQAWEKLTGLEKQLGEPLGDDTAPGRVLTKLRNETALLTVALDPVDAPGDKVVEGAGFRLMLSAIGGGASTTVDYSSAPLRWLRGRYEAGLVLPGGEKPVMKFEVDLAEGGAEVRFPGTFPKDMVYVPAGGGVDRPFFIDRYEVSIGQFKGFDSGYEPGVKGSGDEVAAHGINFRQANGYARSVGKQLPTEAQWLWAAFKGGNARYPWGVDSPSKARCRIGASGPGPVRDCEEGESPFGVRNLAGNVWEWLRDEHDRGDEFAIGGGYRYGKLGGSVTYQKGGRNVTWEVDFLRDKKPGRKTWLEGKLWSDPESPLYKQQSKYKGYQVKEDGNIKEVGFRCVIEL
ncbi:MAG: SUMF1/EgtB/PvdO family nonheme iron enzyme [Planctomycetota bacterium]